MPYSRMIGYLKSAHLAINPLKADALQSITNKLSDYLTVGLPIVSSQSCQEIKTLLRNTGSGIQYEASNPQSLAGALLSLAKDPEKQQQMASASRTLGEQHFHRSQSYEKLVNFIDKQIVDFRKNKARKALNSTFAQTNNA